MKKIVGGIFVTLAIVGLVAVWQYQPPSRTSLDSKHAAAVGSLGKRTQNSYKNGSFIGQTVDVGYGPVQVKVVVAGERIADIKFLQMPYDVRRSMEVTDMAKPILRNETLQVQSANIDIASGATQTSEGYIQSLQDALSQAKN